MRPFFNRSPLTRDPAMRFASRFTFLLFATWLVLVTSSGVASELDARKLLPSSTVIYLEGKSLESVLEHPFARMIQTTKAFKKLWRSPDVMKVRGGLTLFEFAQNSSSRRLLNPKGSKQLAGGRGADPWNDARITLHPNGMPARNELASLQDAG